MLFRSTRGEAMQVHEIMSAAVQAQASDIFIMAGLPISFKINDEVIPQKSIALTEEECEKYIRDLFQMADRNMESYLQHGDDDFSVSFDAQARFRICAYRQRSSMAAVIRIITLGIPKNEDIHIPERVMEVAKNQNGLVLVTGTAGSGKSTTIACIIDRINKTRHGHIVTLEDHAGKFVPNPTCQ